MARNLAEDFRKVKSFVSQGKFGELMIRMITITPGINRLHDRFVHNQLRRKYSKFINEYPAEYSPSWRSKGRKDVIWWLWFQGVDKAPDLCKACLASLRHWYPEKEIITLDKNNISEYADLPDYIIRKHDDGKIIHAHFSDMLRLQLLVQHGGTWIDSTIFCTGRKFASLLDEPFFIPRWSKLEASSVICSVIASKPNNPILVLLRDMLFDYWKEHNYFTHYFIFNFLFAMAAETYGQDWSNVPFFPGSAMHQTSRSVWADEDYSEDKLKRWDEESDFHKLTYKMVLPSRMMPSKILPNLINLYR